ncbi:MAG: Hsp70 family protein, partial [Acidimicrobiia bacterium]|nr:Hsp70 family protein [Acidimicrobiia bacterium]
MTVERAASNLGRGGEGCTTAGPPSGERTTPAAPEMSGEATGDGLLRRPDTGAPGVTEDGYWLGVDLGTTYSAAAVWRAGAARIVGLGQRANVVPSVVFIEPSGALVFGEPAVLEGRADPEGVASQFKRRVGDPAPLRLRGAPFSAELLSAGLLEWVVERVSELEGGRPAGLVLTHPVNWGPYRLELLDGIAQDAGFDRYERVAEPQAAAVHYASQARVEPGALVAVYDFGGGTFDATILRKGDKHFEVVGQPAGLDSLGGVDVDAALFDFVLDAVGPELARHGLGEPGQPGGPDEGSGLFADFARLRLDCVEAKEVLSSNAEAVVPVRVGTLRTSVRVTRAELESLAGPLVEATLESLQGAVHEAGVEPADLRSVLLVGGSSRMPLIEGAIRSALGVAVSLDAHPKESVALGAATTAGGLAHATPPPPPAPA